MNKEPSQEQHDMYSESTKKIITAIREEADHANRASNGGILLEYNDEPMNLNEFAIACHEFLGKGEILTNDLLQERIRYLLQDGKLKQHLPEGYKCCVAVIPCSQYGFPLENNEIEDGQHARNLIVEKDRGTGKQIRKGKTLAGFTMNASYVFHMLPKEIQERCTFEIGKYESSDPYTITDRDRQMIVGLYTNAFHEAQKLLNKSENHKKN